MWKKPDLRGAVSSDPKQAKHLSINCRRSYPAGPAQWSCGSPVSLSVSIALLSQVDEPVEIEDRFAGYEDPILLDAAMNASASP